MLSKKVSGGTVHKLPNDFKKKLISSEKAFLMWEKITPLARNEWICWIESVKKDETRIKHMERALVDLEKGKRRPCCWMGCVHRTDKQISASQKYILGKQKNISKTRKSTTK